MNEFGQRLSELMKKNQMSAYRLAKELDIHQTTIKIGVKASANLWQVI